jgi:hypothetical protein
LIGGNAVILLGFPRTTIDIDFLVPETNRSGWLDLMRELKFRLYHGSAAFAQFEPGETGMAPVDLMFVDEHTWTSLSAQPQELMVGEQPVRVPRPEHLIAMKLHSASSPDRAKPEVDWEDIRQIIQISGLDSSDPQFRDLIVRYGGAEALRRIDSFRK